ncbi:integrase family protein [Chelatococcus sambhunathii]|uniref:Integrase family protein n=1 Tax=Chelatococcus sambhunathii TaxID=363953 RepID=A0ABU1DCX8_9HYPH|nr:integrase family protein [Chelatococcus sambhunathii]MDR4305958.1 integrase family protein [Chelatococcus sambhunathii]
MPTEITTTLIKRVQREVAETGKRQDVADARQRGLELRVTSAGARWVLRGKLRGQNWRLDAGGLEMWSIAEARALASDAARMIRDRVAVPTLDWLAEQRRLAGKAEAPKAATPVSIEVWGKWSFAQARAAYLADFVKDKRREATLKDKAQVLASAPIAVLDDIKVVDITRRQIAELVDKVHRSGRERAAEKLVEVIRPFWRWMAEDAQVERSGIDADVMGGLKKPERSRLKKGEKPRGAYVPQLSELGVYVAIARREVLHPTIAAAVQLLVYSAQRRRPVALARQDEFEEVEGLGGLWNMPPAHRKTADAWGDVRDHAIPLPASIWSVVMAQMERAGESKWLFPAIKDRRENEEAETLHPDTLSHMISYLPGAGHAHAIRKTFATVGEVSLGMSRSDVQAIVDHAEGGRMSEVTGRYALHNGSHFKWPLMQRWAAAIDAAAAEATKTLPSDNNEISATIYGDRRKKVNE